MSHKILVVDDEADIRAEVLDCLVAEDYACVEASGTDEALEILRRDKDIAIVLVDIRMPGKDGLNLVATAQKEIAKDRELEFIIMTGHGGTQEAVAALQLNVLDFLVKPVGVDHLIHVVSRADELVYLKKSHRLYQQGLEAEVQAKTIEVRKLLGNLETAYGEALDCLALAAEYKDPGTGDHIARLGAYAGIVADALGWTGERRKIIELAAPLHDVGKIGTPESILLKPGKLDKEEVEIMKRHAEIGERILSRSKHPVMVCAATIAGGHHERWDGSGYPRGLKGKEIPVEARIVGLGDIYDAVRSERPYKPAFDHEKATKIIVSGDGRTLPEHFDPDLLQIFVTRAEEFRSTFDKLSG